MNGHVELAGMLCGIEVAFGVWAVFDNFDVY